MDKKYDFLPVLQWCGLVDCSMFLFTVTIGFTGEPAVSITEGQSASISVEFLRGSSSFDIVVEVMAVLGEGAETGLC